MFLSILPLIVDFSSQQISIHSKLSKFLVEIGLASEWAFLLLVLTIMARVSCSGGSCLTGAGFWLDCICKGSSFF